MYKVLSRKEIKPLVGSWVTITEENGKTRTGRIREVSNSVLTIVSEKPIKRLERGKWRDRMFNMGINYPLSKPYHLEVHETGQPVSR